MALTLAFDVYGTLIDTHSLVTQLQRQLGGSLEQAQQFSSQWREKQLEYSFRRGLMKQYLSFTDCTRQALDYTDLRYDTGLSDQDKSALMAAYLTLAPFPDALPALKALNQAGHRLFAFSNGNSAAVEQLLRHAGLYDQLQGVISMEGVESFKPDPAGYQWFLSQSQSETPYSWLISSNPFDVIGAVSFGMKAAWVKRSADALFDPWGVEPDATLTHLTALEDLLAS